MPVSCQLCMCLGFEQGIRAKVSSTGSDLFAVENAEFAQFVVDEGNIAGLSPYPTRESRLSRAHRTIVSPPSFP